MRKYTAEYLRSLPVILQAQFDNLHIETDDFRVWLSRMTKEDGAKYNNQITHEQCVNGVWKIVSEYPG